jgi:F-type H+-transporting ATPase subunit b
MNTGNQIQMSTSHGQILPELGSGWLLLAGSGAGWLTPGVAKTINLTIFLLAMYWIVRRPARRFFAERFAQVREMLDRAAREKAAAEEKMAELAARMARLDQDLAALREQTSREIAAERARIEAETKQDLARLRQGAQREIESARQIALSDLKVFAALEANRLAEQFLQQELSPEDDARLIQRVTEQMSSVVQ